VPERGDKRVGKTAPDDKYKAPLVNRKTSKTSESAGQGPKPHRVKDGHRRTKGQGGYRDLPRKGKYAERK